MAKGPMYVKDFNFSSAGKTVGLCSGGMAKRKMASGGYYAQGGAMRSESTEEAKATRRVQDDAFAPAKQLNKSLKNLERVRKETGYGVDNDAQNLAKGGKWIQNAIKKPGALRATLHVKEGKNIPKAKLEAAAAKPGITGKRARLAMTLGKMHKADGGPITEAGTGETYPSRAAMVKHESLETPRMQKQEMIQKSTIKAPALKTKVGRASTGRAAIPPQMPMKKGGFVEGGGMIPNKGTLGVKGNKNPGESGGKAPIKTHPRYNFKDGGHVKKYAVGGPAANSPLAMLMQRAQQVRGMAPAPAAPARPMAPAPAPARPMAPVIRDRLQAPMRPAMKKGGAAKNK